MDFPSDNSFIHSCIHSISVCTSTAIQPRKSRTAGSYLSTNSCPLSATPAVQAGDCPCGSAAEKVRPWRIRVRPTYARLYRPAVVDRPTRLSRVQSINVTHFLYSPPPQQQQQHFHCKRPPPPPTTTTTTTTTTLIIRHFISRARHFFTTQATPVDELRPIRFTEAK